MDAEQEAIPEIIFEPGPGGEADAGLRRLLRLAAQLTGTSFAIAALAEPGDLQRFFVTAAGPELGSSTPIRVGSPRFRQLHARVLATGEPEIIPHLRIEPDVLAARSALGVPLGATGRAPFGTLWVFDVDPRTWKQQEWENVRDIGETLVAEVELRRELDRLVEAPGSRRAADRTERKQAKERAAAFQTLGQQLNTAGTPREAAEIIMAVADQLLGWDACWLDLCDFDACRSQSVLLMDLVEGVRQEVPSTDDHLTEGSLAWRAAHEGAFRVLHTEEALRQSQAERVAFGDLSRRSASLLCAPIRYGGRVFGALSVQSYAVNAYTEADIETLQALADYCTGALQRTMAEAERRALQNQLLQSQKLEAVGRLAGGVAHDFNNMLAVINGYAELLLMRWSKDAADRVPLEEILKAGQRAAGLTRQLLAFSRNQVTTPQVMDVSEAVTQLQPMLRRIVGKAIELETVSEPGIGRVMADPAQVDQLLINLAMNARDAMPNGGKLTLRVSGIEFFRPSIGYPDAVPVGSYVQLDINDTGCGIHPETLNHIFEPFFTTKSVGQGSGLGLASVHGTLKQNGGFIQVLSDVGQGACFRLYLPALSDDVK